MNYIFEIISVVYDFVCIESVVYDFVCIENLRGLFEDSRDK